MVRRSSGGGSQGRGGVRFLKNLPFHIEKCRNSYNDVEQLVDCLQANYFEYGRQKRQILKKEVQKLLESDKSGSVVSANKKMRSNLENLSTSNVIDDDDNATPFTIPVRKKMKNIGGDEERLQLVGMQHSQRRKKARERHCASTSSSFVSKSSDELEDGAVSTSEDVIYGEKYEPEFDLMKLMLRANYSGLKNAAKSKNAEDNEAKNLEIDVVNMKSKKVDLLREDGNGAKLKKIDTKVSSHSNGGVEVKEKDGPRFKDFGGMMEVLEELKTEVIVPLYHPQLPGTLGVRPISGILLHGPPGCGKTKLAHAIANETGIPFYRISATELVSGISGASEENIRELFSKAYRTAPSIVFIDEIDAIASKRDNLQREMEKRIVTQLMTCMDESHRIAKPADGNPNSGGLDSNPGYVLVIGATNRPDAVDLALRRPGRFDQEIVLGFPDETSRVEILSVITRNLKLEGAFDLMKIARSTPGFVGADLVALANKAGNLAMKRIIDQRKSELSREPVDGEQTEEWWKHRWSPEEMEKLSITMADFEEAAKIIQPSSRREGFSAIPNVKWEDVGGLDLLRQEFDRYIVRRIKYPEDYQEFGVDLETGILLYGPPGCGKTLIAKAVANEAGANFIHIKGPELLTKYVGESELAVRTIFSRGRTCSPCILFFDEVDALTTRRGKEGGWVVERLLNQLLIELDGADQRRGVFVVGATNRPDVMDPAVLRPGRFGKHMYVALPSPDERGLILKALARKKPIDASVDLIGLGRHEACKNLSGADLAALMNEAAMTALEEKLTSEKSSSDGTPWTIGTAHFERALEKISPSVTDEKKYQNLAKVFNAAQE